MIHISKVLFSVLRHYKCDKTNFSWEKLVPSSGGTFLTYQNRYIYFSEMRDFKDVV